MVEKRDFEELCDPPEPEFELLQRAGCVRSCQRCFAKEGMESQDVGLTYLGWLWDILI